jgi:hypothetical protein
MSDSHREPDKPGEQAKKGLNRDLEDFARVGRVVATNGLKPSLRSEADEARGERDRVDEVLHQKMKPNQGDGSQANIESARASALSVSSRTWPMRARRRNDDPPR